MPILKLEDLEGLEVDITVDNQFEDLKKEDTLIELFLDISGKVRSYINSNAEFRRVLGTIAYNDRYKGTNILVYNNVQRILHSLGHSFQQLKTQAIEKEARATQDAAQAKEQEAKQKIKEILQMDLNFSNDGTRYTEFPLEAIKKSNYDFIIDELMENPSQYLKPDSQLLKNIQFLKLSEAIQEKADDDIIKFVLYILNKQYYDDQIDRIERGITEIFNRYEVNGRTLTQHQFVEAKTKFRDDKSRDLYTKYLNYYFQHKSDFKSIGQAPDRASSSVEANSLASPGISGSAVTQNVSDIKTIQRLYLNVRASPEFPYLIFLKINKLSYIDPRVAPAGFMPAQGGGSYINNKIHTKKNFKKPRNKILTKKVRKY